MPLFLNANWLNKVVFYWTVRKHIKQIRSSLLYMVVNAEHTWLYSTAGYGAYNCLMKQQAKEKMFTLSIFGRLQLISTVFEGLGRMSKRELIDYICKINKSAKPEFLANFTEEELNAYLEHLMELDLEELLVCN